MLRKVSLGFILVLLLSVFITSEKEKHAHDADAQANSCGNATIAPVNGPQAQKNCADAQRYTPSWEFAVTYRILGWPEGITAWALFSTLVVIGWQSHETRRSAAATEKAAAATEKSVAVANRQIEMVKDKERARVEIKADSLTLEDSSLPHWYFGGNLKIRNLGPSRAYIHMFSAEMIWWETNAETSQSNIPDSGNIFSDSYIDPTHDWDAAPRPTIYVFNTDSINLDWFASGIYEGRISVCIRGVIDYKTVGTRYRRFFSFDWNGSGRPGSISLLLGGPMPNTNAGKMSAGYWADGLNEEEETGE